MMALGAAAQDRGVAGLQAQRAGISGDVGTAFVDDADDADRHAHALEFETIGPRPLCEHGADGIGKRGDVVKALRHAVDALLVQ